MADLVTRNRDALVLATADSDPRLPTSLDQMNPRNRFVRTLADIPVAPGVGRFNNLRTLGRWAFAEPIKS